MEIQRAAGGGGLLVGAPVVDLGVTYPGHELNYTLSPHHHLTNRPLPPPTTKNVNLILNKVRSEAIFNLDSLTYLSRCTIETRFQVLFGNKGSATDHPSAAGTDPMIDTYYATNVIK